MQRDHPSQHRFRSVTLEMARGNSLESSSTINESSYVEGFMSYDRSLQNPTILFRGESFELCLGLSIYNSESLQQVYAQSIDVIRDTLR
ncbi:unnamed protein product [Cochlearia groenlandica]